MNNNIEILETSKGKPSAVYTGYQYRQYRCNLKNVVTWRCINEKSEKCKGLSEMPHSCQPDEAQIDVKKHLEKIKRRVRETDESVSKIYHEEMSPLFQRGYELLTEIPTLSSINSSLHRLRRKVQGISNEAASASEICLPYGTIKTG